MQSPEEFMREFLDANVREVTRAVESHLPFRRKFFAQECLYGSQSEAVVRAKSEKIDSVTNFEGKVLIVTQKGGSTEILRSLRYHLRPSGESWLIEKVNVACFRCRRPGLIDPKCIFCGGTGWSDGKFKERREASDERRRRDRPEEPGK